MRAVLRVVMIVVTPVGAFSAANASSSSGLSPSPAAALARSLFLSRALPPALAYTIAY